MKRIIAAVLLVAVIGCKKGEKGDKGDPGTINTYNGFITSNAQIVSVGAYTFNSVIEVFFGDGVTYTPVPIYSISNNVNVGYTTSPSVVTLYNAQTAGFAQYKIVVINAPVASGVSRIAG